MKNNLWQWMEIYKKTAAIGYSNDVGSDSEDFKLALTILQAIEKHINGIGNKVARLEIEVGVLQAHLAGGQDEA